MAAAMHLHPAAAMHLHPDKLKTLAERVLMIEADAVARLAARVDERFVQACRL